MTAEVESTSSPARAGLLRRVSLRVVLVYVVLAAALAAVTPDHRTNPFNGPMVIAARLLQGEPSLPDNISWMETFTFEGKRYLAYPPMASFLAVPFAALAGESLGQTVFNSLLIFVNALLVAAVFRQIPRLAPFATLASVAWVLGTPQLYSARYGTVWLLMHTESNCFLLLALWCVLAKRAYAWAGLCFCVSALTRHAVFAAAPTFALLALLDPLMNTYNATWSQWTQPAPRFGAEFVRQNLWFYLTAHPVIVPEYPYYEFGAGGQSALVMSPFLIGLLAPNITQWRIGALVPGALAMFVFYLFYSWQGYAQFGSRYMQDLFPFLVPIAFSAFARPVRPLRWLLYVLVAAAIAINSFGLYCVTRPVL